MEDTDKHKMNAGLMFFIILIIAFSVVELFVFVAAFFWAEEVECHWWGCKFTSSHTDQYQYNITYEQFATIMNETNSTKCYYNNTWYNASCSELLKPGILKELEEVLNETG